MNNIFFDTETTGLNPGQIGQLAFIMEGEGKILLAKNYFFRVNEMEEGAEKVHKMSKEFLEKASNGKTFADQYEEFYKYFKDSKLIAHNLKFDEKFLSSELWRVGISFRPAGRQCTMEYFKELLKLPNRYPRYGKYKNPNLGEVVNYFNIDENKVLEFSKKLFGEGEDITFHDARFDTTAMYVATNIHREDIVGRGTAWHDMFCRK